MAFAVIMDGEEHVFRTLKEYEERCLNVSPLLSAIGMHMVRSVQKNFQQGGRPPWKQSMRGEQDGGKAMSATGRLRNSIAFLAQGHDVYVGTNTLYGRIQQHGGTVVPRNAKALAIPLNRAARRAAVGVQSIREIPGLFFIPSKKPNTIGVLARKKGKTGIEPMFALKTSVKVPPRPFLVVQPEDRVYIERITARYIEKGGA